MLAFKRRNRHVVLQRQADIVQTVEQAMLAEGIDLKLQHLAIRTSHGLRLKVDTELITRLGLDLCKQLINLCVAQNDRQQAILEAVIEEDVGIARRDDAAKAVFFQRPGRVLTAGAAAEVFTGQ